MLNMTRHGHQRCFIAKVVRHSLKQLLLLPSKPDNDKN